MAITLNAPSQVRPYATFSAFPATGSLKTIYIAEDTNKIYRWTGSAYVELSETDATTWGSITGTLSAQTDLQTALDAKFDEPTGNSTQYLDGTGAPTTFPTALPPSGTAGGDLTGTYPNPTVHRIHGIDLQNGTPSTGDVWVYGGSPAKWQHQHLNASQVDNDSSVTGTSVKLALEHLDSTKVPTSRTLTINGTTQDLSADRTFTISTGITIGTTAITSGTVGRVLFEGTGNVVQESANLFWDNTNGRLGIGGTPGAFNLDLVGTARISDNVLLTNGIIATSAATTRLQSSINYFAHNRISSSGLFGFLINYVGSTYSFWRVNDANADIEFGGFGILKMYTNNAERMRIFSDGNIGVNTTTNAGYKLDVNGTARVQGNFYFGSGGSYLLSDTNNTRIYDKNNTIILQAFPNGVSNSETYLRSASGNFSFLRLRDDYLSLEYAVSSVSATAQNPIQINRGYFGNVLATDKSVLYVKSTLNSNLTNATTLRGVYIDINDTTTYTGFSSVRAIEAPRGGAYFNTTSVNASAVLQADSTTQGFLPPRMTTTQKNAIASPAEGLQVWDTTLKLMSVYNGTVWITL